MAEATDARPEPPRRSKTPTTSSRSPPPSAAVRHRFPSRDAVPTPDLPPFRLSDRRRSSILSFSSLDEVTQSLRDDLLGSSATAARKMPEPESEVTHWHSSPLIFALLPALAGMVFTNGSAFVTDALLLGLAAIFMNWSIRLPWDWYYSAQTLRREIQPLVSGVVVEEPDEIAIETASSLTSSPRIKPADIGEDAIPASTPQQEQAARELRRQELLALLATFIFPIGAAYLLHVIRAQLSRPSTGLVSDYNLSIFLLAAEVRPFRQLVRLMAHRTLHLQRTVSGVNDPMARAADGREALADLTSRLAELENRFSDHSTESTNAAMAQKSGVNEMASDLRKRYEPRLEGLERAVRRYEKRSTTLAMLTEQRLHALEGRVNDVFSLAALAAQNSQGSGLFGWVFDCAARVIAAPAKLVWTLLTWPLVVVDGVYISARDAILGPVSRKRKARAVVNGENDISRSKKGLKVIVE